MFEQLEKINKRSGLFESYTARELWDDEHTSQQMFSFHLDANIDVSSRKASFIDQFVGWIVAQFNISAAT